jgi:hypothetical protein
MGGAVLVSLVVRIGSPARAACDGVGDPEFNVLIVGGTQRAIEDAHSRRRNGSNLAGRQPQDHRHPDSRCTVIATVDSARDVEATPPKANREVMGGLEALAARVDRFGSPDDRRTPAREVAKTRRRRGRITTPGGSRTGHHQGDGCAGLGSTSSALIVATAIVCAIATGCTADATADNPNAESSDIASEAPGSETLVADASGTTGPAVEHDAQETTDISLSAQDQQLLDLQRALQMTEEEQRLAVAEHNRQLEELVAQCMTADGFPYIAFVPPDPPNPYRDMSDISFRELYGYGISTTIGDQPHQSEVDVPSDPNADLRDAMEETELGAYYDRLGMCVVDADARLPTAPGLVQFSEAVRKVWAGRWSD